MKNSVLKYYVAVFYFCSTFMMFADPGVDDEGSGLESVDPPVPINESTWLLILLGLVFVFFKYKSISSFKIRHIQFEVD